MVVAQPVVERLVVDLAELWVVVAEHAVALLVAVVVVEPSVVVVVVVEPLVVVVAAGHCLETKQQLYTAYVKYATTQ